MAAIFEALLIAGWLVTLPVVAVLIALFMLFAWSATRPVSRSRAEVIERLRQAESGEISEKSWKRFADRRIADERLDAIRIKARLAGPPHADRLMLRQLIGEAEKLSS